MVVTCFMIATDLTGYAVLPVSAFASATIIIASTAICAKKSDSRPKIFDESVVFATEKATSRPIFSVFTASCSLMNLMVLFITRVRDLLCW